MYSVSVKRDFIAQHMMVGGDWGPENEKHSHPYQVEVQLEGGYLDQHGFLLDITDIDRNLDDLVAIYRDSTLNDLPEFEGLNPSLERFAQIFCQAFIKRIQTANVISLTVRIWENQNAWASFQQELIHPSGRNPSAAD